MPSKDPEKRREAVRRYAEKHKEEVYARQRAWVERNREKVRAYGAEYAKRPETKAKKKAYAAANAAKYVDYHQRYREEHKAEILVKWQKMREGIYAKLNEIKRMRGCPCGERDVRCLDFHHRDPKQKEFNIGRKIGCKWERILAEIEKCDVICANCHRRHHISER